MTRTLATALFTLATATISTVVHADDGIAADEADGGSVTVLPCRPTIACTADLVPGGTLEIETGYAQRRATGPATNSVQALAKYSVTDHFQLQVGTNNVVSEAAGAGTQTFDGVYVGPKVKLVDQTDRVPSISVSALVMTPTRDGDAAAQKTKDAYLWAYASKDLPWLHADFNVGANILSYDDHPAVQEVVALSLSKDLGKGIGAMLEGYGFWNGGMYTTHDAGVLTGLTYAVTPRVMFDAGFDVALYRDARNVTMFAGVTFVPYTSVAPAKPTAAGVVAARQ